MTIQDYLEDIDQNFDNIIGHGAKIYVHSRLTFVVLPDLKMIITMSGNEDIRVYTKNPIVSCHRPITTKDKMEYLLKLLVASQSTPKLQTWWD
jgi:hypothetical protein